MESKDYKLINKIGEEGLILSGYIRFRPKKTSFTNFKKNWSNNCSKIILNMIKYYDKKSN